MLDEADIADVMKIRLHMGNMGENFRTLSGVQLCQFCCQAKETTEHVLMECEKLHYLREDLMQWINVDEATAEATKSILMMSKRVGKIKI